MVHGMADGAGMVLSMRMLKPDTLPKHRPCPGTTPVTTVPKSVVFCKDDVSLPPGAYLGMAQTLGEFDLIEVEGSHEALFTNPGVVAQGGLEYRHLKLLIPSSNR